MKIGLEIHQQLATKKLFCHCPSRVEEGEGEVKIVRQLHPVLSELGKVDRAAVAEAEKQQQFEYWAYHTRNCLVETDEEPPHAINSEALVIALQAAEQLKARPVHEVHVMRKLVIDGSNTSGFQRTAIVAMDGTLKSTQGAIGIPQIAIEEESAGIVQREQALYRLDRLGIPLIEISTAPEIKDGKHAQEVAEKIGLILRATGKVARGLGTIRQDLNISIEGGARVEIKGVQDLKLLPIMVDNEVRRQQELLKLIKQVKRIGLPYTEEPKDITGIFQSTRAKLIATGLQRGERVFAMAVKQHAGLLGKEINPNRRYATELSEYAKTAGAKGIVHSDEDLKKYGIPENEINAIKQKLAVDSSDAFILVVAPAEMALKALAKVKERLGMLFVPEETRRANADGTSSYMRPLPGSARMYPETDVPPIELTGDLLKDAEKSSGESLEEKQSRLRRLLNDAMAKQMLQSPRLPLFERLVQEGIDPMLAASTLENTLVALRREGITPNEERIAEVLHGWKQGTWTKAAIQEILRNPSKEKELRRVGGRALEKLAQENDRDFARIMQRYRLQVDAKELQEILKKKK